MPTYEEERIEEFKKAIDFASAITKIKRLASVAISWPMPTDWPKLDGERWVEIENELYTQNGSVAREYIFKVGDNTLIVEIFVSSSGADAAREWLLQKATNSSMESIPFVLGPTDLGHISVRHIDPEIPCIYWVFYNVCIHIDRSDERNADLMPLARFFQKQMDAGIVADVGPWLPKIERVELSSTRVAVGAEFRVWLALPQGVDSSFLEIQIEEDQDRLNLRSFSKTEGVLRASNPGRAEIKFHVTDSRTLLYNSFSTVIEVIG